MPTRRHVPDVTGTPAALQSVFHSDCAQTIRYLKHPVCDSVKCQIYTYKRAIMSLISGKGRRLSCYFFFPDLVLPVISACNKLNAALKRVALAN